MADEPKILNGCIEHYSYHCAGPAWRGLDACSFYKPFKEGAPKGSNCFYCANKGAEFFCLNEDAIKACASREPRVDTVHLLGVLRGDANKQRTEGNDEPVR